jgi:ubiquinone/menaquinone biosynthesis C-methylase UbiE
MKIAVKYIILNLIILLGCSPQGSLRDRTMQPELIMETIGIKQGMIVGEVGAGEGYFTFNLSKRVGPDGKIYANDIKPSVLDTIRKKSKEQNLGNITVVQGATEDPNFPAKDLDMIVMMLVYHELEKPIIYFQNIRKYLRPGATVVVIERNPDKWGQGEDHFMTKVEILDTIEDSDYEVVRIESFLEIDDIYILHPRN